LGRTLVVGDLHGCYDELMALLDAARLGAEDRVICVGDLVTKGNKSREVLELFMSDARFAAVLGNHDRALLDYWRGRVEKKSLKSAQRKCAKELKDRRDEYAAFLGTLPLYVDLGSHVVVHAGLRPGVALEEQTIEDLTELRTLGEDRASREKFAIFGHWPAKWPRRGPRALGLDTGCVYGNRLTAYVVETGALHSVPALRAYDLR
jgi:predicted MPP superfamily phosphohydrolase